MWMTQSSQNIIRRQPTSYVNQRNNQFSASSMRIEDILNCTSALFREKCKTKKRI